MSGKKCIILGCGSKKKKCSSYCRRHALQIKKEGWKNLPIRIKSNRLVVRSS